MEEQTLLCTGCSMPKDEVWPTDGKMALALSHRFVAKPVKCMACAAVSEASHEYEQMPHDAHGIHWILQDKDVELDGGS